MSCTNGFLCTLATASGRFARMRQSPLVRCCVSEGKGAGVAWSGVTATRLVDPLLIQRVLEYRTHKNLGIIFSTICIKKCAQIFAGKHRIVLLAQREGGAYAWVDSCVSR
jgi:hypothetical protein